MHKPPTLQQQMRDFEPLPLDLPEHPEAAHATTVLLLVAFVITFALYVGVL